MLFRASSAVGPLLAPSPHSRLCCPFASLLRRHRHRKLHVYTHGEGFLGCLGHGNFSALDEVQRVDGVAAVDIRQGSAGWTHSAAVDSQGRLLVWGRPYDFKGSLRLNNMQRVFPILVRAVNAFSNRGEVMPEPVIVPIRTTAEVMAQPYRDDRSSLLTSIAAAATTATTSTRAPPPVPPSNTLMTNFKSGFGQRDYASMVDPTHAVSVSHGPAGPKAVGVACSAALTVVLTERGRVYCMGQNRWGQCGQGPSGPDHVFEPLLVRGKALSKEKVVKLAIGFQHCLVLCESGAVYGWGKGERGQLGTGDDASEELAVQVRLPGRAVCISSGFNHAVALLENGDAYIWGKMQHFEVKKEGGIPLHHDQLLPRKVDAEGVRYVEVFCSSFHTVLRADNGEVLMCGVERDTRRMVHKPVKVDMPGSGKGSFLNGFNETLFHTTTPEGRRRLYALTYTSEGAAASPFVLPGLDEAVVDEIESVSVGWKHTIALL